MDGLKDFRAKNYGESISDDKNDGMDKDEPNSTSRIIKLSDDEQKSFQGANPGENLTCEITGSLEKDGHFHVMTVSPPGGGSSGGEEKMAQMVVQRVMPTTQLSPS